MVCPAIRLYRGVKTFNYDQCLANIRTSHKQWKFDYCNDYRKPIDDGVSRVALREIRMGEVQSI